MITTASSNTSGKTNFHHTPKMMRPMARAPVTTAKVGVNRLSRPEADW